MCQPLQRTWLPQLPSLTDLGLMRVWFMPRREAVQRGVIKQLFDSLSKFRVQDDLLADVYVVERGCWMGKRSHWLSLT